MKDKDTGQYKMYSRNKELSIIVIVCVLFIGVLFYSRYKGTVGARVQQDLGNPFNCAECKLLGHSCKEHRGFDLNKLKNEKIQKYTYNFIPGKSDTESRYWMYEAEYNLDCDFCCENQQECYGCKYDRESINRKLEKISRDEVFKSKLNNEDWKLGYADSKEGRVLLLEELRESMTEGRNK